MPIDLSAGAQDDLEDLERSDPDAADVIWVVLEEADADPELIRKFTDEREVQIGDNRVGIKPWDRARGVYNNLFRFRVFDTPATKYRVVYGYDWRSRRFAVLAVILKKGFNYAISDKLGERILADWREATGGRDT